MTGPIRLELPDGSILTLPAGTTPRSVAEKIGPGLARAAVAAKVDGELWDLDRPIFRDCKIEILTPESPDALWVLRHSSAHVLATAVRQLFPEAQIGFGPPIEDGFYYDFDVPRPFTPEDLQRIEERMREVVKADYPFVREEVTREEARRRFKDDPLKLERLEELGDDEVISVYTDGPFTDLCRGPHVPSTGYVKHFKLLHAAGAYWRGDSRRQMLQRIYGTAYFTKEDLEADLRRREEAEKRDHRVIGRQLDLFSIQEDVGPGLVLWHPRGAVIQFELRRLIEDELIKRGYELVYTPHVTREQLFIRSGHLPLYEENQFPAMAAGHGEVEEVRYRVKPMNCPMHILIYASRQRSYRDLPLRLAEVANVYRNELSGALHGMLRVRGLTMDDAHIFCREDQIEQEIFEILDLADFVLHQTFGLEYRLDLATRPEKKLGTDQMWDTAEAALRAALERRGLTYGIDEGGGAFYGPKIDIKLRDAIGREWQGTTIQLDYELPERFELEYTGADNRPHRPVMIHRAIYGTLERFVGMLIEHFAGAFPVWLAPEQVRVLPISEGQIEWARTVYDRLRAAGVRVHLDQRNETLNYRIRDGELMKVPYLAVVGRREAEQGTVAVRARGSEKKQEIMALEQFVELVRSKIASRALSV
ncbi:MAG: threonine--tRNA ligase [Gemmatimonadales bacterium]|nr:Threonine--tRNA ligase [bacterium HR33]GIW51371.1 MAG: threonine--tRNA ligase [Gemmatimonadales bacterium]